MRDYEVVSDIVRRAITIFKTTEFGTLLEEEARSVAEEMLRDEGSSDDWCFESVERVTYDRAVVVFVGA